MISLNRIGFISSLVVFGSFFNLIQIKAVEVSDKYDTLLAHIELKKGIDLLHTSMDYYFTTDNMVMHRFYNPFTKQRSAERASVWMYTAVIEAVNAILKSMHQSGERMDILRYEQLLENLYANADYYLGTFELTSFTQKKNWSVYAVDRVNELGKARVTGIYNVYDDQMWLIRELLDSYHLTKNQKYLEKAEYLTAYVLDGWDATRDELGMEHGGIPWGPGYVTKHACSNGPMVSPLVWLYEIYKNKKDYIEYRFIDPKDKKARKSKNMFKRAYYLDFAQKIYNWQKKYLLRKDGVYADMMGGCDPNCSINYETINGNTYRANTILKSAMGRAYSYNAGTMLSGATDLYRVTKEKAYLDDAKELAKSSFAYFARKDAQVENYYTFPTDGFNNWFNTVLLRGYTALLPFDKSISVYVDAYRNNLNYGYSHFYMDGMLPTDLLKGWESDHTQNNIEGMFMFSYITQFAIFNQYMQRYQKQIF